jgi:hypothetical protein
VFCHEHLRGDTGLFQNRAPQRPFEVDLIPANIGKLDGARRKKWLSGVFFEDQASVETEDPREAGLIGRPNALPGQRPKNGA